MAPTLPQFSAARMRSYVFRLPLFTRSILGVIVLLWLVSCVQRVWEVEKWGALVPLEVGVQGMYRTNTYPLVHAGVLNVLLNVITLTPLLERFEAEYGTLTTLTLFMGPLSTIPALLYTLIERAILRMNTPILGASIWVFTLLGMEAVKQHKTNPYFQVRTTRVPTWVTPLAFVVVVSILVPHSSFLGHLCGLAFGYGWGFGYLRFLAVPEKILRWIENKLNPLGRLPHYVSVDQKTYGRFGVLPTTNPGLRSGDGGVPLGSLDGGRRLGP